MEEMGVVEGMPMTIEQWERLIRADIRVIFLYHYNFIDNMRDILIFKFILEKRELFIFRYEPTNLNEIHVRNLTYGDCLAAKRMTKSEILECLNTKAIDLLKDPSYDLR